jgi:hypothetical protein
MMLDSELSLYSLFMFHRITETLSSASVRIPRRTQVVPNLKYGKGQTLNFKLVFVNSVWYACRNLTQIGKSWQYFANIRNIEIQKYCTVGARCCMQKYTQTRKNSYLFSIFMFLRNRWIITAKFCTQYTFA